MYIEDPNHLDCLVRGLQDLYTVGLVTDVTLVAGDTEVPCHRSVLAACSPYFRSMFRSKMLESRSDKVHLHNLPGSVLRPMIDYLYYSNITITNDNVQDLFCASSLFELIELYDLCAEYMLKQLDPSNCMGVYRVAQMYENEFLQAVSRSYMMKHFNEIVKSGELNTLSSDDFIRIISNDDLDIKSEEVVFEAVVSYVQHDFINRKSLLPTLMKSVRLGLLSEEYMNDVIGSCDMIMKDAFCRSMLMMARLQVAACGSVGLLEDEEELDAPSQLKRRYGMHCTDLVVFISAGPEKHRKGMGCYNPNTARNYYTIPPEVGFSFVNRIDHHRAVLSQDGHIVVGGGVLYEEYQICKSGEATSEVAYFDFDAKSWITMPQMIERRCAHAMVSHRNLMYAIGGKSLYPMGEPLQTMECYNDIRERWDYVQDLPVALAHHQAIAYKNQILVFGGVSDNGEFSKKIYAYKLSEHEWETFPAELEYPRADFGAALIGNELYICGGWNGKVKFSTLEIINLDTLKWRRGTEFFEDRTNPALFVFGGELYLCGGMRTLLMAGKQPKEVFSRDLWKYDMKNEAWLQEAKLVPYANTHAFVVTEVNLKKTLESDFISKK